MFIEGRGGVEYGFGIMEYDVIKVHVGIYFMYSISDRPVAHASTALRKGEEGERRDRQAEADAGYY